MADPDRRRLLPLASCLVPAALLALAAAFLSPRELVDRHLPAPFETYRERLVAGLGLSRACLALDALLLAALPVVRSRLFARREEGGGAAPWAETSADRAAVFWLFAFALLVRAYRLSSGFTVDELVISMSLAEQPWPRLLMRADPHRMVVAAVAHLIYGVAGVSEVAGRAFSLATGAAGVPLLYLLARRWATARAALAASAFLALSTFHVWYSQLLTAYAPALTFLLLAMLTFEDCQRSPSPGPWLRWGACTFLAIVTHFQLALFLVLAQGLRVGWRVVRGDDGPALLARFAAVVAYSTAPAALIFSPNFFLWRPMVTGLAGGSEAHLVAVEPRGTVPGQVGLFVQWICNQYAPAPSQAAVGLLLAVGLVRFARRHPGPSMDLMLPTIIIWTLFSAGLIRRITPRHSIFTLIPASLFTGSGVAFALDLAGSARRRGRPWAAATAVAPIALAMAGAVASLRAYYATERLPFKETAAFLASHVARGDDVVGVGYGFVEFQYYYPGMRRIDGYESVGPILEGRRPAWFACYGPGFVRAMPGPLRARFLRRTALARAQYGLPEQYLDMVDGFVYRYDPARRDVD